MTTETGASAGSADNRPAKGADSTSRRVLEDVLKQTAALYSLDPTSDPADLEPLLEVARRYREPELSLDPILIELVRATLSRQPGKNTESDQQLKLIAERVARTLFENPDARARVNDLWVQLQAVAQ